MARQLDPKAADDLQRPAIPDCARQAAAQGSDLAPSGVQAVVEDAEDSRAAVGLNRIRLYRAFCGARIGQQMLRVDPGSPDAVVQAGANAVPPTSSVQDRSGDAHAALARPDALCRADPGCAASRYADGISEGFRCR